MRALVLFSLAACRSDDAITRLDVWMGADGTTVTAKGVVGEDPTHDVGGSLILPLAGVDVRRVDALPGDDLDALCAAGEGGAWEPLAGVPAAVDLFMLEDEPLMIAQDHLRPGVLTEVRLVLDGEAVYVDPTGVPTPVTVPSGEESGLKLKGCVPLPASQIVNLQLLLDLEGVLRSETDGGLRLHPTVAITDE